MSRVLSLAVLLALVACASTEPTSSADRRSRYLSGYSISGPVKPAEFTYENRNATLQFPAPTESRTFTRLETEAIEGSPSRSGGGAAGLDDDYDPNADFGYYGNEYGGAGRFPEPIHRPEPPIVRPPPRPEPPIAKPDPEKPVEPAPGPEDRRRAKTPPEKPARSRDATKPPRSGRKK